MSDEGAQLLRLYSSLLQVSNRREESLGKPWLCSQGSEIIARLDLAEELFHNQLCGQRWKGLSPLLRQCVFSHFTGKVNERKNLQPNVSSPGPSHRASQTQGQKITRRQHGERRERVGSLERLRGRD